MKNKGKALIVFISTAVIFLAIAALSFNAVNKKININAQNATYQLLLNRSINSGELSNENATFYTTNNNPITFSFDSSKAEIPSSGVITLLNDGLFYNESAVSGINNVSITLSTGSMEFSYGNNSNDLSLGSQIFDTHGENNVTFNVNLAFTSNYFQLKSIDGPSTLKEMTINYSCLSNSDLFPKLKTAVFADVQLSAKENGEGYYANAGNTVHAYVALKNHLKLCKEKNVDVIFMNGDIVNNAVLNYYEHYEEALRSVYGNDESQYPEIIYNIGNHEWWDIAEKETADAVALFKQYARINTPNLVRESSVEYYLDNNETIPSYYKVVNGIPFLMISGEDSSGKIGNVLASEIASWLEEIDDLPSVQKGGPIYVGYHYPLNSTLTHGNGAGTYASVLENLLKNYPQAVVFTGDTHYSGVNERAINQVNFTTINIGSSSYSRMDKMSATMTDGEHFYNMQIKGGKTSDELLGDANYMHEYTPTIHIVETLNNQTTVINRYFSTNNEKEPIHINKPWYLPNHINVANFEYTNDRFQNTLYAQSLYGANGVSWPNNATVRFGVQDDKMTVIVPDTKQYHYTEHYSIEVTGNTTKTYDVVNNYYLYNKNPGEMYFFLEDLPTGNNYSIKVNAYDYFDNPSLNYLTANVNDISACADEKDNQFTNTYYELSTHLNYQEHTKGNTSLEYYYNGVKRNEYGAPLGQLIRDAVPGQTSGGENISNYLSIGDTENCEVILKARIKNLSNTPLVFGYTLYGKNYTYKAASLTMIGQTVTAHSDWVSLEWNITASFPEVVGRSGVTFLALVVSSNGYGYNSQGYEMHLLVDDLDVVAGNHVATVEGPSRNNIEMCDLLRDDTKCGLGEISYSETRGLSSTTSRKFTFADCTGFGNSESSTWRAFLTFDVASSLGPTNGINPKTCTLSFDVKFSSEILNSSDARALAQFTFETNAYSSISYLSLSSLDGSNWMHVQIDLSNISSVTASDDLEKIRLGFYGIYTGNKDTAYIIVDNLSLLENL